MNQIALLSGKGGTGKTTVTASFAVLSSNAVFADCDVDASNLHLLLKPHVGETLVFKGLEIAEINSNKCTQCGLCEKYCRFEAIKDYKIDPIHCEGCGVCEWICPTKAVSMVDRVCGHAFISSTKYGPMSHARLKPGMENSGKLVTLVKENARKLSEEMNKETILIDCPPGIGCPVIASLSNVKMGVVVVEPTLSGIHDLKRALGLLEHFQVDPYICVNKFDLNKNNTRSIYDFCGNNGIEVLGKISFDPCVTKAMVSSKPVIEFSPEGLASREISVLWRKIQSFL